MKLSQLRDFIAMAKAGSMRAAARELGLAQPALTRSLRDLEQELGVSLVERQATGIVLTDAGTRFIPRARAAMEELRRGSEEAMQIAGTMKGAVSVGLSSAALLGLAPTAYPEFRKACPQIRLRLLEGVFQILEPRLRDGSLDFHVGPRPPQVPSQYQVELLFHNERCVMGRRGHPLRTAGSLRTLREAPWIVTGLHQRIEDEFEEVFSAIGLQAPASVTQVDSMLGALVLLTSTDSLVILPRQWADTPLFAGQIEAIAVREPLPAPDIVQIARAGLPLTPAAELLSTLLRRAGQPPAKAPRATVTASG
jgi:DNA-binding transcriptional LysR family regulator